MTKASQARGEATNNVGVDRDVAGRLYDIGLALTSDLDLSQVLLRVLESAVSVVDADIATVHTYSAELDRLGLDPFKRVVTIGASKPSDQYAPPRPGGQTYLIARERDPIWSNNARQAPVFKDSPFTQNERVDSVAGIPLVKGDETVGVLYFNYYIPGQITPERLQAMRLFANQAAIAIANARLFEERRQREKTLYRLIEVGARIIREAVGEGLRAVLLAIVQGVCEITGADCAVLYPYDPSRQTFYDINSVASYGVLYEPFKLSDKPRLEGGMAALVRREGKVVINDIDLEDPAMLRSSFIAREKIRAFMGVSLVAGGSEVGVLYINYRQPHFFDRDERNVIQILGNQAAVAIQNARQIRALQEAQEQRLAAERWAILGKLVPNLMHRINNTVALIPVVVQDLKELLAQLPDVLGVQVDDDLSRIERNAQFTLEMADLLLKPFKAGPAQRLDVNVLLKEAVALSAIPDTVNVDVSLSPDLPHIFTSPLLVDVFVELISNAVKAMPHGGRLEIGSRLGPEDQVEIWFSDTGVGIPNAHREKVFDLFFTTHEDSLGFGLWWVKTFLLQQGGIIGVKSEVGRGTTFTIRLPVRQVEPAAFPSEVKRQEV
ncbi:MAG: GAF domain-containing protein [Anaerolineae bacterium]